MFPSVADVTVLSVDVNDEAVRVEARSTTAEVVCPSCGCSSSRIHSSYLRFPADVPSAGRRVVLCLRVRRFFCLDAVCGRRTFVEQMPGLTRRYCRWTERLRSTLAMVGLALAGRAGARMASVFGVSVSRSTVLRLVDMLPEPDVPAPRVVGVDEYATRKGRVYGTVLVDCETRRPVDLLPDREASSLSLYSAKNVRRFGFGAGSSPAADIGVVLVMLEGFPVSPIQTNPTNRVSQPRLSERVPAPGEEEDRRAVGEHRLPAIGPGTRPGWPWPTCRRPSGPVPASRCLWRWCCTGSPTPTWLPGERAEASGQAAQTVI